MAKREVTTREYEVLRLVALGIGSADIARQLGISRATVDSHVRSAMAKLGARSRLHAAVLANGSVFETRDPAPGSEEERLVALLAAGMTREHMARALYLSRRSVDRRVAALRRKVGATSTAEAVLAALGVPESP
jgi:DNA-binding CsgD family transcriptional regulator